MRHTHREVPQADIDRWMSLYGTLLTDSMYVMNGDFETDVYSVRLRLNFLIPEFLPIRF